jgi:diguanylate cyclase (GGDEF)-like protein
MVALKIIEAVSQPYVLEGQTVSVTSSAGIGIYPIHGEDADTLMKCADQALYEAKRAGKNAYRIAEPIPRQNEAARRRNAAREANGAAYS